VIIPEESKISKTLSDKTIKTVVMLVLFLLFMLSICSADTYIDSDIIHKQGLKNLKLFCDRLKDDPSLYGDYKKAYEHYLTRTTSDEIAYKLVFLQVPDPYQNEYRSDLPLIEREWEPKLANLRKDEY